MKFSDMRAPIQQIDQSKGLDLKRAPEMVQKEFAKSLRHRSPYERNVRFSDICPIVVEQVL